ncbi:hypothetical protein EYF80_032149 [Liparis tanakae]|uniref:Uncharacterized protein n=1 Tax=Liparis tanakae TaxID=230148 RepID=A0A4Z2GVY5_9TELE|nr:hypothetical protein EYF80_032149 [Liparis tanakae]
MKDGPAALVVSSSSMPLRLSTSVYEGWYPRILWRARQDSEKANFLSLWVSCLTFVTRGTSILHPRSASTQATLAWSAVDEALRRHRPPRPQRQGPSSNRNDDFGPRANRQPSGHTKQYTNSRREPWRGWNEMERG